MQGQKLLLLPRGMNAERYCSAVGSFGSPRNSLASAEIAGAYFRQIVSSNICTPNDNTRCLFLCLAIRTHVWVMYIDNALSLVITRVTGPRWWWQVRLVPLSNLHSWGLYLLVLWWSLTMQYLVLYIYLHYTCLYSLTYFVTLPYFPTRVWPLKMFRINSSDNERGIDISGDIYQCYSIYIQSKVLGTL